MTCLLLNQHRQVSTFTIFPTTSSHFFPTNTSPTTFTVANSAPFGLLGFAIASSLTGFNKIFDLNSTDALLFATALLMGGFAQLLAGIFQLLSNKTHAATIFLLYGSHWTLQGILIAFHILTKISLPTPSAASIYDALLAIATFVLFIPALHKNAVLSTTLALLFILYVTDIGALYGIRAFAIASGVAGILAGALGFYAAAMDIINSEWKRSVLPSFEFRRKQDIEYGSEL